ncbi:hypothetical protein KAU39_00070 [bacterium]|nr:hypothetical protein [bacterium]
MKLNKKGQNVIEYILIIAVLAAGIIIAGGALKSYLTSKGSPAQYEGSTGE